jgi:cytochrome c oxidase assembly factor CtaG
MAVAIALAHYGLLASGYHGPPRLTPARAFTEWSIDPFALAVLVLAGGGYAIGVRKIHRAGGTWSAGRTIAFCAGGVGLAFIATSSFLSVYGRELFYIRSFQTVLFLLGIPLFVMLGRPLSLVIGASPRLGQRLEALVTGRVARIATFPAITAFVLVLTPFVVYFSPWYAAGFHSGVVRELTYLALVLPGLVFFWTLLRIDPVPAQYPYIVALWVTAAEVVGDAALGLAVIADRTLIAGSYYHAVAWPWGPSLASDQVIGGGTLWVFGDVIGLPFLAAILIAMIREDESEARSIDAQLDAEDAASLQAGAGAVAVAVPAGAGDSSPRRAPDGTEQTRPDAPGGPDAPAGPGEAGPGEPAARKLWWEEDPRFADRFAPLNPDAGGRGGKGK